MTDTTTHKQALQEQLTEVTAELKTLGIHDPETDDWEAAASNLPMNDADPNIDADAIEDTITNQGTLAALENRYRLIKHALQKIEADTYGNCEVCEAPIAPERLAVYPAARTCMEHTDQETQLAM